MIRLDINGEPTGIRGEALSQAVIDHTPAWLVTTAPAPSGMAGAVKAGIKGLIPLALGLMHKESIRLGHPLPAPNFKSPEARASIITYAIRYLLDNFAAAAEQDQFQAIGQVDSDGTFIIDSIISTPAQVGQPPDAGGHLLTTGDPPGAGSPQRGSGESDGSLAAVGRDGNGQDEVRQGT